jgi:C-terminal processing protease CtpA/Prc
VQIEGADGAPDTVDFAVATPELVRQWVSGLQALLHVGSVGIGLQVVHTEGGKFIVHKASEGGPSEACRQFRSGDVIDAIDTVQLTQRTSFAEFETLVLGLESSPICIQLDRRGHKVH